MEIWWGFFVSSFVFRVICFLLCFSFFFFLVAGLFCSSNDYSRATNSSWDQIKRALIIITILIRQFNHSLFWTMANTT